MQIAGSRLTVTFQQLIITQYPNMTPPYPEQGVYGWVCTGWFLGLLTAYLTDPGNVIYSKHRLKALKARKAAFHKLKAFRIERALNRLFHRSRWGFRVEQALSHLKEHKDKR